MVADGLDHNPETVMRQLRDLVEPYVKQFHGLYPVGLCVKYLSESHCQCIGFFKNGMVFEQDVDSMPLNISSFVSRHHQGMFGPSQYLSHGLSIGISF